MVLRKFKEVTVKWFGGLDFYCINYMIYVTAGFWSLGVKRRNQLTTTKKWYWCFQIYLTILYIYVISSFVGDLYVQWPIIENVLYSLSNSTFFFGALCHLMFLNANQTEVEECFRNLNNNFYLEFVGKTESDLISIEEGNEEMRKMTQLFFVFFVVGVLTRIVCNLAPTEQTLIVPFPFIPDPPESPYYEILFWIQALALLHFAFVIIASEMVVFGFFIRIRKQYEIITKNILDIQKIYFEKEESEDDEDLVDQIIISQKNTTEIIKYRMAVTCGRKLEYFRWRREKTMKKMREIIIHHQHVLILIKKLNHGMQKSLFVQILGGGLLLAALLLDTFWKSKQLSMKIISQTTLATPFIITTTILCTYGSQVESRNKAAEKAVYGMPWFLMDYTNRKTVTLFLMGLQRNPIIKAGGVLPINRVTYLKFIKLIYNLVAFMQNAASRDK